MDVYEGSSEFDNMIDGGDTESEKQVSKVLPPGPLKEAMNMRVAAADAIDELIKIFNSVEPHDGCEIQLTGHDIINLAFSTGVFNFVTKNREKFAPFASCFNNKNDGKTLFDLKLQNMKNADNYQTLIDKIVKNVLDNKTVREKLDVLFKINLFNFGSNLKKFLGVPAEPVKGGCFPIAANRFTMIVVGIMCLMLILMMWYINGGFCADSYRVWRTFEPKKTL